MITARQVYDAQRGALLRDLPDIDRRDLIRTAVTDAYRAKGLHPQPGDIDTLTRATDVTFAEYISAYDDEVALVLQGGIAGSFGPNTYLSAENIASWALAYINSATRLEAIKNKNIIRESRYLEAAAQDAARRQHAEFVRTAPTKEWNAFVAAGGRLDLKFDGYAAAVYDALKELGKVHPSVETLAECRQQAAAMSRRAPLGKVRGIGAALNAIDRANGAAYEHTTKRLLLERYFRALYDRGITPDFTPTQGREDLPQ